jgi:arylsulfatase A-like enzyme
VLLITIDTLRADHLGCYGGSRATSPEINRLARDGALFERVTASLPRTTQSVASILTGRFPAGHQARGLFSTLDGANLTLAEILRGRGYATAAVTSNLFLRPGRGFEQGFDHFDNPPPRWDGDSAADVTAAALARLRDRPKDRPLFLWVHYLDPHWTYRPGPPFDRAFDPAFDQPFTLEADLAAGRLTKGQVIFRNPLTPRQVEHVVALYDGEIAQVDAALAPLLAYGRDRADGMIVVVTSDHGESLGEHGYHFAHGEYLYEPGLRVPLVVAWPGRIPAGTRVAGLAQNIDVAPTIAGLLGIDRMQAVDGRPLLAAEGGTVRPLRGRELVFAESDFQLIHPENPRYLIPGPAGRWSSVSDGRLKLIRIPAPGGDRLELYDLAVDPGETRDLGSDPARSADRARLLRPLLEFTDSQAGAAGAGPGEIAPEDAERLRSLGYVN